MSKYWYNVGIREAIKKSEKKKMFRNISALIPIFPNIPETTIYTAQNN